MNFKQEIVFYLEDETERYARIVLQVEDNHVFNIVHTYVSDSHRGEGLAGKLMEQAIAFVNTHHAKLKADCSYAKHYCEKHNIETVEESKNACSLKHAKED